MEQHMRVAYNLLTELSIQMIKAVLFVPIRDPIGMRHLHRDETLLREKVTPPRM